MVDPYQKIIQFKYRANLLYTESVFSKNGIACNIDISQPLDLFVNHADYKKACAIVKDLELDETEVDEDSDGYISGYEEWSNKMYVDGYFTGGVIPRWMFDKKYATWFGPIKIITGLFILLLLIREEFSIEGLFWGVLNTVCGTLLTIRGFKNNKF